MATYAGSDKRLQYLFEHIGDGGTANLYGTTAPDSSITADDGTLYIQYDDTSYEVVALFAMIEQSWQEINVGGGGGGGGSVSGSSPFIDGSGTPINLNPSGTTAGGTWTATMDCFVTFYANWGGSKFFEIYIDESVRILYPYNTSSTNRFEYVYVKKGQVLKWNFSDNSSNYHVVQAWPLLKNDVMQTALIYSEEEREVGVWIDGKPLYQKTIIVNNPTNNTDLEYDLGVTDLDEVISQEGTWDRDMGSGGIWTYDLNATNERSFTNSYIVIARIRNGTKKLYVYVGTTYPDVPCIRFTFRYTKTTDVAGSGTWTTTGEYAHHYNTSEKVVGTWIDGSTLYEITVTTGASAPTGATLLERRAMTEYDVLLYTKSS